MSEKGFWSPDDDQLIMMSNEIKFGGRRKIAPDGFKVVKQEDMEVSIPSNVKKRCHRVVDAWAEKGADTCFYRDDFKDEDFETICELFWTDQFLDLRSFDSYLDYFCENVTGKLIECEYAVDIMDLCKRAYDREHGQGGSL